LTIAVIGFMTEGFEYFSDFAEIPLCPAAFLEDNLSICLLI